MAVVLEDFTIINMPRKSEQDAIQRIDSHEKLCRIMQKQTQNSIDGLQSQINRIERILLVSAGALFSGMAGIILVLLQKL
jgi:hypothetical protein